MDGEKKLLRSSSKPKEPSPLDGINTMTKTRSISLDDGLLSKDKTAIPVIAEYPTVEKSRSMEDTLTGLVHPKKPPKFKMSKSCQGFDRNTIRRQHNMREWMWNIENVAVSGMKCTLGDIQPDDITEIKAELEKKAIVKRLSAENIANNVPGAAVTKAQEPPPLKSDAPETIVINTIVIKTLRLEPIPEAKATLSQEILPITGDVTETAAVKTPQLEARMTATQEVPSAKNIDPTAIEEIKTEDRAIIDEIKAEMAGESVVQVQVPSHIKCFECLGPVSDPLSLFCDACDEKSLSSYGVNAKKISPIPQFKKKKKTKSKTAPPSYAECVGEIVKSTTP